MGSIFFAGHSFRHYSICATVTQGPSRDREEKYLFLVWFLQWLIHYFGAINQAFIFFFFSVKTFLHEYHCESKAYRAAVTMYALAFFCSFYTVICDLPPNNGVHCLIPLEFSVYLSSRWHLGLLQENFFFFYLGLLKICLKVSQVCYTPKQSTANFKRQRECKMRQTFQFAIISNYNLREVLGLLLITIPKDSY